MAQSLKSRIFIGDEERSWVCLSPTHRFLAGTLYQDRLGNHRQAVEMFDAYLRVTNGRNVLGDEAKYRLSRSLIALGQKRRAERLLLDIIAHQEGTDLGAKARKLLESKAR